MTLRDLSSPIPYLLVPLLKGLIFLPLGLPGGLADSIPRLNPPSAGGVAPAAGLPNLYPCGG